MEAPWSTAGLLLTGWGMHAYTSAHMPTTCTTCLGPIELRGCLPGPADPPSRASPIASMPRRVVLVAGEGMQGSCFEGGGPRQPKCVLPEESQLQSGGWVTPAITSGSAIITASLPTTHSQQDQSSS